MTRWLQRAPRVLIAALTFAACREGREITDPPAGEAGDAVRIVSSCPLRQPAPPEGVVVRSDITYSTAGGASLALDADRIVAVGYSAGAHLASLLGTAPDVDALDGPCPSTSGPEVQGVISYAGPQDLRVQGPYTAEQEQIVTHFLGVFPGDDPDRASLASPLAHVSAGDPPFLFVHGSDDPLVPIAQSRRMRDALRDAGVPATVMEVSGIGHGFVGLASSEMPRVRCTTLEFLDRISSAR